MDVTVQGAIAQVIEAAMNAKDPYTVQHQQRVTGLALSIANEMGLPADTLEKLKVSGILHDLGKISIPSEILVKPNRLSDVEFSLIKTHPMVGSDILKPLGLLQSTAQIVLQHHERWNGSGYPNGLLGDNILLEARILGVADVVEAMASDRPYRPGLGIDKAMEEVTRNKGILYDPMVANACSQLYKEHRLNILESCPMVKASIWAMN